jgi:hypothetical protein
MSKYVSEIASALCRSVEMQRSQGATSSIKQKGGISQGGRFSATVVKFILKGDFLKAYVLIVTCNVGSAISQVIYQPSLE